MPNTRPTSHLPAPPDPAPTSGSDWRAQSTATAIIKLPLSGIEAEVGHVHLNDLVIAGKIPDYLTPLVVDMLWSTIGQGENLADKAENTKEFFEVVDIVVRASLVNPRVVDNPTQPNEIALTDLDFGDRILVQQLARQPLGVLHRFRVEQESTVDAVPEGEDVQPATE